MGADAEQVAGAPTIPHRLTHGGRNPPGVAGRLRYVMVLDPNAGGIGIEGRIDVHSLILQYVSDAVIAIDNDGVVTYMNPAAERQYSCAAADAIGRPLNALYQIAWVNETEEADAAQALSRDGFWRGQNIHTLPTGEVLHVESAVTVLTDPPGVTCGLLAVIRDVTSARRATEALRERDERMRRAFSIETVGVLFYSTDGRVTDANAAFERMTGYTVDELRALDHWHNLSAPEFVRATVQADEQVLARGEAEPYKKQMVRKDGSRWWALVAAKRTALTSAHADCMEFVVDITEAQRGEAALRDSEQRLRILIESVEDYAIFTTDVAGVIQTWNTGAQRIFGWSEAEARGQHARLIFTPEDQDRGAAEAEMDAARRQGCAADERWHVTRDGSRFFASGVLTPLRDDGTMVGYVKVTRDLTEHKALEDALQAAHDDLETRVRERTAQLAQANASLETEVSQRRDAEAQIRALFARLLTVQETERRRMARDIHDQLGQSMTALKMNVEGLQTASPGTERFSELVGRTQRLAQELDDRVDFLTWELRPAALDHLNFSEALADLVRSWSDRFGVQAEFAASHGHARLSPDAQEHVYRLVQEALHNTVKHAGAQHVSVLLAGSEREFLLVIEDDGCGFEGERVAQRSPKAGLGLTSMRERAALAGGELTIESAPGRGTSIFVRIALADAPQLADGRA